LVPVLKVLVLVNTQHPVALSWRLLEQWLVMAVGSALCTPLVFRFFALLAHLIRYQTLPETRFRDTRQIKRRRI